MKTNGRMRNSIAAVGLAAVLLGPAPAQAQTPGVAPEGAAVADRPGRARSADAARCIVGRTVRVTARGAARVGQLVGADDATLTLAVNQASQASLFTRIEAVSIPRGQVRTIEVLVRPAKKVLGTVVGALVGLGVALATDKRPAGHGPGQGQAWVGMAAGMVGYSIFAGNDKWALADPADVCSGFVEPTAGGASTRAATTRAVDAQPREGVRMSLIPARVGRGLGVGVRLSW